MKTAARRGESMAKVRSVLKAHEDGLTMRELVEVTGLTYVGAHKAMVRLAGIYVDRYVPEPAVWKWMPVFCMADGDQPDDTPKPDISVRKYMESRA